MWKYPKSYKHFINWMYKKVTRLEREAPNRFRILTSRGKDGNLECVMFADLDCGGGSFHKVVNPNRLVYYTYNLSIKFDRQVSKELFEKEFIALAYADHIDAFVPNGRDVKLCRLKPDTVFHDVTGDYKLVGVKVVKIGSGKRTYYELIKLDDNTHMLLSTESFCDCTVDIVDFYNMTDKKEIFSPEYITFETREEFTEYFDKMR